MQKDGKVGAIWEKEGARGTFLSHSIEFTTEMLQDWLSQCVDGKVKVSFISFKNTPKPGMEVNPRAPAWNTMLSQPKDGGSKSVDTSQIPF